MAMDFYGTRVIESVHLVEDGIAWLPCGRSGWRVKRTVKVPYRGAVRLNASTLVMHPATVQTLREQHGSGLRVDPVLPRG